MMVLFCSWGLRLAFSAEENCLTASQLNNNNNKEEDDDIDAADNGAGDGARGAEGGVTRGMEEILLVKTSEEHKMFFPSSITALSLPPPPPPFHTTTHASSSSSYAPLFVGLDSGDIYRVTLKSPERSSQSNSSPSSSPYPLQQFTGLAGLLGVPPPGSSEDALTREKCFTVGSAVQHIFALSDNLLVVSCEESGSLLLFLYPTNSNPRCVKSFAMGPHVMVTAAILLSPLNPSHIPFHEGLLSHTVGVDRRKPVILFGMSDGSVVWLPVPADENGNDDSKPCQPFFLRRFSPSSICSVSIDSNNCCSDGDENNRKFRICIIHRDGTLGFIDCTPTFSSRPFEFSYLKLPFVCQHFHVQICEGIVFYLTQGGQLLALILQDQPAVATFIDKNIPPMAVSSSSMKPILEFSMPYQRATGMCLRFSDGSCYAINFPNSVKSSSHESLLLNVGLKLTAGQIHSKNAHIRINAIRKGLRAFGAFPSLLEDSLDDSRVDMDSSIRTILANITTAIKAKEMICDMKAHIDAELLSKSALVQLFQSEQWHKSFSIRLDIRKSGLEEYRNDYFGVVRITTSSEVAMRSIHGRTVRLTWRSSLDQHTGGMRSEGRSSAQSYTNTLHFQPPAEQSETTQYVCELSIPLTIDAPCAHSLAVEVVVSSMLPHVLFGALSRPLHSSYMADDGVRPSVMPIREDGLHYKTESIARESDRGSATLLLGSTEKNMSEILAVTTDAPPCAPSQVSIEPSPRSDAAETQAVQSYSHARRLKECLSEQPSTSPVHSLTSFVPHAGGRALNLFESIHDTAKALPGKTHPTDVGHPHLSYAVKSTVVSVKSSLDCAKQEVSTVKALHHKSNSRLVIALKQAELHMRMEKILVDRIGSSAQNSDSDSEQHFCDSDIYALPHELQQAMMECQAIQRKLSSILNGYSDSDSSVIREQADTIWRLYQLIREYGV